MKGLAWFIAKREIADGSTSRNVMVHIATAAVAISIAVVIISLAILFGFKEQVSALISGITPDVKVTVLEINSKQQPELYPINDSPELRGLITSSSEISQIERYALRNGVIRGEDGAMGIVLKGVDSEANVALFASRLESGAMPRMEEARRKEILISEQLAKKIGAQRDSRVEILLMEGEESRRELFKVCGIYRSTLGEEGSALALTDIRNVQKLNGWEASQISGYGCRLADSQLSEFCAAEINSRLMYDYNGEESIVAVTAKEEYGTIFGWLETHDVNAVVVLTIMLIVAIFNVLTALLILVLERTRTVGILKAMGMTNKVIRRIFTHHAARIIVLGIIIGNAVAITMLLLQKHLHLVKLEETGYFLSEVPVSLGAGWIIATDILFTIIIIAVTYLASSIIGRIKVAEAIKYS